MNIKRIVLLMVVSCLVLPSMQCQAQKLKLPGFLPFKKKSKEIKPFELSDRSRNSAGQRTSSGGLANSKASRGVFDFLKPKTKVEQKPGAMAEFNNRSKAFFSKTGEEIGEFAHETREFLIDSWNPPKARTAWWNKNSSEFATRKQPFFQWPGSNKAPQLQPPPMPQPRTARRYQDGQPKHRF